MQKQRALEILDREIASTQKQFMNFETNYATCVDLQSKKRGG